MSKNSVSQLLSFFDTLPEPIILVNRDYTIVGANMAYLTHYPLNDQHITGLKCYENSHRFCRPCNEEGESCLLKNCLKTGLPQRKLHIQSTPLGNQHSDIKLKPIRNEAGEVEYIAEIIHTLHSSSNHTDKELVGRSPAFRRMQDKIMRVGPSHADVLLLGESGTGKELVAHAVHHASHRSTGPFVAVDCSNLPENLFESELFGYEKGAFSGANQRKQGLVEAAKGGTLFLD